MHVHFWGISHFQTQIFVFHNDAESNRFYFSAKTKNIFVEKKSHSFLYNKSSVILFWKEHRTADFFN